MISATHRTLGLCGVVGGNRGGSVALGTQQHSPVFRQTHKKVRSHGKQLIRHIGRVAIFHLCITPLSRADGVNVIQAPASAVGRIDRAFGWRRSRRRKEEMHESRASTNWLCRTNCQPLNGHSMKWSTQYHTLITSWMDLRYLSAPGAVRSELSWAQ